MSRENRDWCKFFQDIEADPKAIVSGFKVRDLVLARQHLYDCDNCNVLVHRVLAARGDENENTTFIGLN